MRKIFNSLIDINLKTFILLTVAPKDVESNKGFGIKLRGKSEPCELKGYWAQNCKFDGVCVRGGKSGGTGQGGHCYNGDKYVGKDSWCGRCTYGWRGVSPSDYCCTWDDYITHKDCVCLASVAGECMATSCKDKSDKHNFFRIHLSDSLSTI